MTCISIRLYTILSLSSAYSTETFYRVSNEPDHANTSVTPSGIIIEIHNPKPPATHWYAVTIESYRRYSGRAKLLGVAPRLSSATNPPVDPLVYTWTPPFSGDYRIIVHELLNEPTRGDITVPLPITTFRVDNKPNFVGPWGLLIERMTMLPPCQNVHRLDVYTNWDGMWIGPDMHSPEDTLRNKWFFLPSKEVDCKIETFAENEFKFLQEEKRIYILGNSKERGIFLSLVDLILDGEEKAELEDSVISQCWGRAVVSKHNMKVMYQDWRSDNFDTRSTEPTVVCHNEKVAREGGPLFFDSGMKVWEEIFRGDKSTWPHVILMSTGNDILGFKGEMYDLNEFVKRLPPDWDGKLLLTDGAFGARMAGRGYASDYEAYHAKLMELTYATNDPRIRWVDGMGLSKEMIMYGEYGPEHTTFSQHFHRSCDESYEDVTGELKFRNMRICSNVTENIAQLLIGHAVGPKAALLTQKSPLDDFRSPFSTSVDAKCSNCPPASQVLMCHNCPKDLLPFHITPYPDMTCTVGPLHPRSDDEIKGHAQTCPEQCMEVEVKRKFGSQTDQIYERHCPYNFFPRGFQVGSDAMRSASYDEDDVGSLGYMVWVFNSVLILSLFVYKHRAMVRARLLKILDEDSKV
jgi:hypothetical protein